MAAVPGSNPDTSGSVTRKLTVAPISASQRVAPGLLSRPNASSTAPKAIGSQMATLKRPILVLRSCSSVSDQAHQIGPQLPCQQAEDAQHHHQRIPREVAG